MSFYLSDAINAAVYAGEFPSILKNAIVVPVYKKGDYEQPESFRPISLLASVSKIFERVLYDQIMNFLNENDTLYYRQYGFRPGLSTENSICDLVDFVNCRLSDGEFVVLLMFDLSRAFDCISPNFCAEKLESLGIRGFLNKFINSFLEHRKFRVKTILIYLNN